MRLALCGLQSGGKTTLFAALAGRKQLTGKGRDEANQALLTVPDERVDRLSALFKPKKTTYAQISFVDPPQPAAKADDPTTKLPLELRQADGLVEVVRNFDGGLGAPDPAGDHRAFRDELILNDLITVEKRLERIALERQRGRKLDEEEVKLVEEAKEILGREEELLAANPGLAMHPKLRGFGLLTARPRVVVVNNEEDDPEAPDLGPGVEPVVVRGLIEAELAELGPEERAEFMEEMGIAESTLDRLIRAGYQALDLISFFTVGEDEVRAWTIRANTLAPQAAGAVHSDLEKGFIRAEVMDWRDILKHGGEAGVKKAGLMKLAGKDHVVSDGEVMHVRFSV